MKTGMSYDSGSLDRLCLSPCPGVRGVLLCSQFSAFTEGCCHITQSSFFAQIVKFGHLERNSVYHALMMHIIEHCSDTIQYTVLNLAQLGIPFFLLSFAQANHLFLAKALREVSQCSSAGCAARDTCPQCTGLNLQKGLKKNRTSVSAFIRSLERLG